MYDQYVPEVTYKNKEWLYQKYHMEGLSTHKIATLVGLKNGITVLDWMRRLGVPSRSISESNSKSRNGSWKSGNFKNKSFLEKLYFKEKLSKKEIADRCGVSLTTINRHFKRLRIAARPVEEAVKMSVAKRSPESYQYERKKKPPSRCTECGGVNTRGRLLCAKCRQRSHRGSGNPNYRGGADLMSRVRSWAVNNWRPLVFARDNYTCQSCGDKRGGNLQAHHIEQLSVIVRRLVDVSKIKTKKQLDKTMDLLVCHPKISSIDNGITLCQGCHRDIHRGKMMDVVSMGPEK